MLTFSSQQAIQPTTLPENKAPSLSFSAGIHPSDRDVGEASDVPLPEDPRPRPVRSAPSHQIWIEILPLLVLGISRFSSSEVFSFAPHFARCSITWATPDRLANI